MSKLEFYLSQVAQYGLYAILLTPLAFWPPALFLFLTPKFILFQILTEIVFGAWFIIAVFNSNYRPKFNWLTSSLFLFFAVSLLSAFFGIDFSRSFWGIGARMTGLFAELHFFAWFLVLISMAGADDNFKISKYLNFSFAVSVLVALSAFYQNPQWGLGLGSTIFNNPTFVAPYFFFHFFWGLYQFIQERSWFKWLFATGSLLILAAVLAAQIRGAVLGLLAGLLLAGVAFVFGNLFSKRSRIIIAVLLAIISLGLIIVWQFRNNDFIKQSYFSRLSQLSFSNPTAQTRLIAWQMSLKGFRDKPWFGTGPENFNYLFNAHYNPKILKYGLGETWFDKPHNAFLEILTELGVIGSLAYILLWFFAAVALKNLYKQGQKLLSVILAGAFVAYLGSIFFAFDSFGSWFGLYLFLAFLVSRFNPSNNRKYHINPNGNFKIIFRLLVLIFLFELLYINYGIWRANIADAGALRIFPRDPAQGIVLFKKSLSYKTPYKSEYQFDLIASIAGAIEKGLPLSNPEDVINFMLQESDKAVTAHPSDAAKYTDMVRIYNILGTKGRDPEILAQAEVFGKKSLKLSPQRQETLYYLARTALLKNDAPLAVNFAKQAVLADTDIKQSHWYLGLAYIASSQRQRGITEIKKALEMGYKPQNQSETNFIKSLEF